MRQVAEFHVRLYKRESAGFAMLPWEARALFHELLRRVDMAGMLMVGRAGVRGVAALVRMPLEVVHEAMHGESGLVSDGCVVEIEGGYLIRNFLEAQRHERDVRESKRWSRAHYGTVIERDGATCRYCRKPCVVTIDHVVPRARGGGDEPSNLVVACRSCNSRKGARTPEEAGMVLS